MQQALDDLVHSVHGNCSVVLIAHRLSTVLGRRRFQCRNDSVETRSFLGADKIVVMDQGLVAEEGTHEDSEAHDLLDLDISYAKHSEMDI